MDEAYETEWQWFRRAIRDSLLRPSAFAASLARQQYGLAGVLVALLAGVALSVSVDWLVLAAKGLNPLSFATRIGFDAALLGLRLAIVAAVVSAAVALFMRLVRRRQVTIDRAFTALTFALTPLYVTPLLAAMLAIVPELLTIVGLLAVLLLARLLYGLVANIRPLAPLGLALAAVAIVIGSIPLTLPDQISRIEFTALAYQPSLAPVLAAEPPAGGRAVFGDGYQLSLPARWTEVHLGIAGEIGHYETQTDVLTVVRASGGAFLTPDSYAENAGGPWRRGLERTGSSRSIVRSGGLLIIDDLYRGTVDGRPELLRQFTTVIGSQGLALLFRYIEPNEARALSESSSIAASWRVGGR